MKAYSFSKNKIEFIAELRKEVKDYFEQNKIQRFGNANLIIQAVFMLTLYLGPLVIMSTGLITSVPLVLLGWFVVGLGMAGLGMDTMHDANHSSFSKSAGVNKWLGYSLYLLGGYPPNWRFQHNNLHHGFTNIDGQDEDIAPPSFLRFSPHQPLKKAHKYQYIYAWFFYSLMTVSWITTKDFKRLAKYKKMGAILTNKNDYKQMLREIIISKIGYYLVFLALPMVFIPVAWYWVLLGFVIMHLVCGFILGIVFQAAHVVPSSEYPMPDENGVMDNSWAVHQLYTTCDFAPKSRVLSWFIGGLNYQIEHHLFPNISHVHYKRISAIVQKIAKKHDLPYHSNRTFLSAIRMHAKMLKSLGEMPVPISKKAA